MLLVAWPSSAVMASVQPPRGEEIDRYRWWRRRWWRCQGGKTGQTQGKNEGAAVHAAHSSERGADCQCFGGAWGVACANRYATKSPITIYRLAPWPAVLRKPYSTKKLCFFITSHFQPVTLAPTAWTSYRRMWLRFVRHFYQMAGRCRHSQRFTSPSTPRFLPSATGQNRWSLAEWESERTKTGLSCANSRPSSCP